MDSMEYLGVKEKARLEGCTYKAELKWLERHAVASICDPKKGSKILVPVSALSGPAYKAWMKEQVIGALQGIGGPRQEKPSGEEAPGQAIVPGAGPGQAFQPALAFAVPTQREQMLLNAVPPAIPHRYQPFIDRWAAIIGDNVNGTWKRYVGSEYGGFQIRTRCDFIRAQAKVHGIGLSTIHSKLATLREVNHNPDVPRERKMLAFWEKILPKARPGRSGAAFFSDRENAWMREKLLSFYFTQAKRSMKHAHRLLVAEIDAKQRAWGVEKVYERPTLCQSRTLLKKVDLPTKMFAREGEEAYRNKCSPYLKRRPPEKSGDFSVTDQKVFDILCRDSGWRLARSSHHGFGRAGL